MSEGIGLFLGLTLLLRLPELLLGTLPWNWAFYWEGPLRLFSLDLFGLASLLALVPASRTAARSFAVGSVLVLLTYETYEAIVVAILHRQPIFSADLSHVLGALYLVWNAGTVWHSLVGLLGLGGGGLLLYHWLPPVVKRLHRVMRVPGMQWRILAANVVVWSLVGFAAVTKRGIERHTYNAICLSTTECIVHNAAASLALNERLIGPQSDVADSTYVQYQNLDWTEPPSLYLVVVESYGSVLAAPPRRAAYDRLMTGVTDSLAASGWNTATAHSTAPVFGGLSWLSVASVLLGTPVEHQPTFDVLRPTLSRYPHLVHLLQAQGYVTAALQPPVRSRPGLSVTNPYDFDHTFYFRDLNYGGPSYGWGIVPDQYSLAAAHERFVEQTNGPFFLFFETVTSHAPWNRAPPPLAGSPATMDRVQKVALSTSSRPPLADTLSSIERLARHVRYDWRMLANYLRTQAPLNSLVLVLGDHQPYVAEPASRATLLHVLSRDERLVRRFSEYGFTPGLRPAPATDTLHHAGLYSMLVRILTAHDRAEQTSFPPPLPPYRPQGVPRSALLPNQP